VHAGNHHDLGQVLLRWETSPPEMLPHVDLLKAAVDRSIRVVVMPGKVLFGEVMDALNHGSALATLCLLSHAIREAAQPVEGHTDCLCLPKQGKYWTLHPAAHMGDVGELWMVGTEHPQANYSVLRVNVWHTDPTKPNWTWTVGVHRLVAWLHKGVDGLLVGLQDNPSVAHHTCKVRACCNHQHLSWHDKHAHAVEAGKARVAVPLPPHVKLRVGMGLFGDLPNANRVCKKPKPNTNKVLKFVADVNMQPTHEVIECTSLLKAMGGCALELAPIIVVQ
jgi:hypothetical protein